MTLVLTFGIWDLLHVGHLAFLEHAAALGDRLFVGVPSDEVVTLDKGQPPVIPFAERAQMVEAIYCVDAVIPYHALEFTTTLRMIDPDILAVGADWGREVRHAEAIAFMVEGCGRVVRLPRAEGVSTSEIKRRIRDEVQDG